MRIGSLTAVWLIVFGTLNSSPGAEFTWAPSEGIPARAEIVMVGDIESGDTERLRQAIRAANKSGLLVISASLYSRGGSLSEGLGIGRVLRANLIATKGPMGGTEDHPNIRLCSMKAGSMIPFSASPSNPDCACYSACALAWIGGVWRVGQVGFHRAYLRNKDAEYGDYEGTISKASTEIRAYLEEMRVPSFVFDRIMATASVEIVELSSDEQDVIRVDPVFSEFLIARCGAGPSDEDSALESELIARKYAGDGISRAEDLALSTLNDATRAYATCRAEAHREAAAKVQAVVQHPMQ